MARPSLLRRLLGLGGATAKRIAFGFAARFDAAQTNGFNNRHWAQADALDPNAALSPSVRKTLRERARYEVANNSYLDGMLDTRANDIVGPDGPTLDMEAEDDAINDRVEDFWSEWASAVGLAEKLQIACRSKDESGEVFLKFITNPKVDHPVKLDIQLIESDQVANWRGTIREQSQVDGIEYDAAGNPTRYFIMRNHPGSLVQTSVVPDEVSADNVIHYFRAKRPGQGRGYPLVTASLPLWAYLRRFTLATVQSAETSANFSAVMTTPASADGDGVTMDAGEEMPISRGAIAALPEGYDLRQFKPEHPISNFAEFVRQLIREAARCLSIPLNVALGDSSSYNYASGRLDHQTYDRTIRVERALLERVVLHRIFRAWMEEAVQVDAELKAMVEAMGARMPRPSWLWSSREHVDPLKEANAESTRLANNTTTVTDELAKKGQSLRKVLARRAREIEQMRKLGIPIASSAPAGEDEPEEETTRDAEASAQRGLRHVA